MNNSSTGTFENASNSTATIATLAGNTGTINQSGATGTISFTNAALNTGKSNHKRNNECWRHFCAEHIYVNRRHSCV
jgi:hypothetical protein